MIQERWRKLPKIIYGILCFLMGTPNRKIIEDLKRFQERGCEIVVITARPRFLKARLEKWMNKNNIPYSKLICTGPFGRKRKKISFIKNMKNGKRKVCIDDEDFLKKESIQVIHPDALSNHYYQIFNDMAV